MTSLIATPAIAETVSCIMEDDVALSFEIDRTQFAPAHDGSEPPRRKLTTVEFGPQTFPATPFLIAGTRGFHADALGGATAMFVMQPDGSAHYSVAQTGEKQSGTCEVLQ